MTEILQIFSGNPLSTFVGKKVEAATRPELDSDDWALNLEICDIINESDDDAKDAARAIRKRLQQIEHDKNFNVTNRTLTVLETCVSNCSRRFHVLVMTKDFTQDLVKLIGPKNNPPLELQERVLRLIERWAEAFKTQPDLGGVVAVYNDLKSKGVTFPQRDSTSNVPIQTPQRSVLPQQGSPPRLRASTMGRQQPTQLLPQPAGPIVLEGEGYGKISRDVTVVQSSIDMFNEILQLLETNCEESDWKLAADLNTTCRQMKERIVDLIERVANEDLTIEFLRLNDNLNTIFTKYDRLIKNRTKTSNLPPITSSTATADITKPTLIPIGGQSSSKADNELTLIDFNTEDGSGERAVKETKAVGNTNVDDPFDTTAIILPNSRSPTSQKQLDPITDKLSQLSVAQCQIDSSVSEASGLPEEVSSVREQDFAEIENWLKSDSGRDLGSASGDLPSIEPISIANSEFENFIATRALAGSSAPTSSTSKTKPNQEPEPSM